MSKTCMWCGSSNNLSVVRLWESRIEACDECKEKIANHICLKCGHRCEENIFVGGYCEDCARKLTRYREKSLNNEMRLQSYRREGQNLIDDKKNGQWVQGLFSTNKIQMTQTEDQLAQIGYKKQLLEIVKESETSEVYGRNGYALKRLGVQRDTLSAMTIYHEDLENFLESYSKMLISESDDEYRYVIVFLDAALDNMTVEEKTRLIGYGSHYFLLKINSDQKIGSDENDTSYTLLDYLAERVNKANGIRSKAERQ